MISETGDNNFTLFTQKGFASLAGEMLDWVIANWRGRGSTLKTEVHEYQGLYCDVLDSRGFLKTDEIGATRQYDLSAALGNVILPPGYRIVDMVQNQDWASKRRLQVNAFRNENDISELDLLAYEYSRDCPCYDPAFDLSVIDENGMHVSSCVGFLDYDNRMAEVERVCTQCGTRASAHCRLTRTPTPTSPPMGQRSRLKASFAIDVRFSTQTAVILRALKRYGMILADNGSSWFISGAPDERWDNDALHQLDTYVKGSDFEAVDESSLMIRSNTGQVWARTFMPLVIKPG